MQIFSVNKRHPVEASGGASLEENINVFSEGDENLLLKIVTVSLWESLGDTYLHWLLQEFAICIICMREWISFRRSTYEYQKDAKL